MIKQRLCSSISQPKTPISYYSFLAFRELHQPIPRPIDIGLKEPSKIPKKNITSKNVAWEIFEMACCGREYPLARQMLDERHRCRPYIEDAPMFMFAIQTQVTTRSFWRDLLNSPRRKTKNNGGAS